VSKANSSCSITLVELVIHGFMHFCLVVKDRPALGFPPFRERSVASRQGRVGGEELKSGRLSLRRSGLIEDGFGVVNRFERVNGPGAKNGATEEGPHQRRLWPEPLRDLRLPGFRGVERGAEAAAANAG
jgi:hypothetical protein